MKRSIFLLSIILFIVFIIPELSFPQALAPYDDFSEAYIDKNNWIQGEFVREIKNGKLLFKQASPNPIAVTSTFPYVTLTSLDFINPNSIHSIEADVSITNSFISGDGNAAARLEGTFFNDGTPGLGHTGDIYAEIALIWTGSELKGFWWLGRYAGEGWSSITRLGGDYFSPNLSLGTTYTLYLGYNIITKQFTFEIVGVVQKKFGPMDGLPARVSDPKGANKSLETWVQIRNNVSSGYISATFDNVYKNGALYDRFSSAAIDPAKWTTYEFAREISAGELLSKTKSNSASVSSIYNSLDVLNPSLINAIQAKVTPVTYENNQGADAVARIAGYFYHDGTPGGTRIGQVGGQVRIGGTGQTPVASWLVWKETDEAGTSPIMVGSGIFTTPVVLGNTYTLFLGWDGDRFTFKVDDEVAEYNPVTSINPSKIDYKTIGTRIFNPAGKEAIIEALFDDVMVNEGEPCPLPSITTQPQSQTIQSGQTATLSVAATDTTPLSYQWYQGASGDTSNPISGATSSSWTTPPLTQTTNYWVRVANSCGSTNSNTATITVNPLTLQSPSDGAIFNSCTLITKNQPSFTWTATETFTSCTILLSTPGGVLINKATARGTGNSWIPSSFVWKKLMTSCSQNGEVYWKVIGTRPNRTTAESEAWSFSIGPPQPVAINAPLGGPLPGATPPTFDFDTNCSVKFKLEITSVGDFSDPKKIKSFNYTTRDPNMEQKLIKTLSSFQWGSVKKLVGTGTGHFRIKAWDGINRENVSQTRSFTIQ